MADAGKILIFLGLVLVFVGVVLIFGDKIPFVGKLPGDLLIKKGNFTFFAPIATTIVISLILTLVLNLIFKFKK